MSNDDDLKLINSCLAGNKGAFEELINKYQRTIFNVALRMVNDYDDAEDISQTVFIKAYNRLDTFKPKYKFFSWLYRMLINESLNFLGKKRQYMQLEQDIISKDMNPEEKYRKNEFDRNVNKAVGELPVDYRVVIVFRHFANLSYKELSYVLDIPIKTVKSRLYTARQILAKIFLDRGIKAYE
ncbi:MAG: RNA polymerase sigma factor [Candidatus Zixiibacteriota bacterium]|nr:MAG: RNA polymerase sigma factor [candidate division Zixibacteria bacterium]HHI03721.1 sigma-70 family RNA polymerase sigma factor [candidate division Zixibacteria bacterium]